MIHNRWPNIVHDGYNMHNKTAKIAHISRENEKNHKKRRNNNEITTNMTNEEIDNAIAVLQAYKEGKTIQVYDDIEQQWFDSIEPTWDFGSFVYRVKPDEPKPHYRPFLTAEEVMEAIREHGGWITNGDVNRHIVEFHDDGLIVGSDTNVVTLSDAFDNLWNFADGTPFGKLED